MHIRIEIFVRYRKNYMYKDHCYIRKGKIPLETNTYKLF